MGNKKFRDSVKPQLQSGYFEFIKVMPDGGDRLHDGTNNSNEIGLIRLADGRKVIQKVMLTSPKYHQRRKAMTEMVHAWLDEGLGGARVVPLTYAETFYHWGSYLDNWGEVPLVQGRRRICQVVHEYKEAAPGDEWRGAIYRTTGNLETADQHCFQRIFDSGDCERIALLDFLTINQDRSARNWITDKGERFYAIDNGMAWFHEYPHSDDWKIGTVIDDVLIQKGAWRFISGIFTTIFSSRPLTHDLSCRIDHFNWPDFLRNIDMSCDWLGLPPLSEDWRFLGIKRRFDWIRDMGRFPTGEEYRGWLRDGSDLMTPPEIVAGGGKIVWRGDED